MPSLIQGIRAAWERLSGRQRAQVLVAVLATAGLVWGVVAYGSRVRYETLYADVEIEDAAEIVEALKQQNVDYRTSRGGRTIEVPSSRIDELRMALASEGLPRGGGAGFELFDNPTFGMSSFVQNINYRRALERELARSIQSFDSVETARVHLALPEETVFADERQEASASVVLRLRGERLPAERVRAIVHLVASGVEGLESSRVSVVDGQGRMLSDGAGDDGDETLSASQGEARQAMERRIETTLVTILEPVVGRNRVRARATVELETARVRRTEERYDPDGAVLRSEKKKKSSAGGAATGGAPGADANLPGSAVAASSGNNQKSQESMANFEINRTVSEIAEPRGGLVRQSVAVVVDHGVEPGQDANGNPVDTPVARSADEMEKITSIVRAAVGIDESRGDVLTVENVPFDTTAAPEIEPAGGLDWIPLTTQIIRYVSLPLAVLLIALLIIRPAITAFRSAGESASEAGGIPTVGELQASLARGATPLIEGGSTLRQRLIEAAKEDPKAAALIVRGWMGRGE